MRRILTAAVLAAAVAVTTGCASTPPPVSQKVQDYYDKNVAATAKPTPTAKAAPLAVKQAGESLRVLFAGDSLTGGLHASTQAKGFKWLMLDAIEKQVGTVEEMSSALSGGTTLEVSAKYDVPTKLDLAIVELGTNDKAKATPIPEFQKAYVDLLNKIKKGSPNVALVCAGIWEDVNGGPDAAPYNNVISKECTSRGGKFVTLTPIYKDPATIGPVGVPAYGGVSDNFHPNDIGHRDIADALLAQIKFS